MKTIEEAAKEYASKSVNAVDGITELLKKYAKKDFKAGAEFAQRWIPVEKEIPCDEGEANGLSKVVIAKCEDLTDEVSAYHDSVVECWKIYPNGQTIIVTHWRPIHL